MPTRKSLIPALVVALLTLTAACQPADQQDGQQAAAVDTAAMMATFDSLRVAFETAFEEDDFETMASYYAADATASFPGTPVLSGREEIRAAMEESHIEGATLTLEPLVTRIIDSDWVYEMGTGTMTFTPEGADEPQEATTTHLVVFHRTGQGWRIVEEVLSANEPPPSTDM